MLSSKRLLSIMMLFVLFAFAGMGRARAQEPAARPHTSGEGTLTFPTNPQPFRASQSEALSEFANWPTVEAPVPAPDVYFRPLPAGFVNEVVTYNNVTGRSETTPAGALAPAAANQVDGYKGLFPRLFATNDDAATDAVDGRSVIGADDRVRIFDTTSYPWRTVVRLYVTYPDGSQYICSGSMIDAFHVLTAGHCVYSHDEGPSWYSSLAVAPGQYDASTQPYAFAWATGARSYTGWTNSASVDHDWAVVTLDRNIGNFTGWMGRQWAASNNAIYTGVLNVAGYPGDLGGGCCMYYDSDNGDTANDTRHWYWMDTAGGMSGGPVWRYDGTNRYILTVHAYGVWDRSSNSGTRLNEDKFNRINTWVASDTAPTDRADLIDDGQAWSDFTPTSVRPGDSFTVYNDVRNIGTAAAGGFYVDYFASTNTTISGADYLIGWDWITGVNPFTWTDADLTTNFPGSIPAGTYYVGWIIDSLGGVTEFNESNNTSYVNDKTLTVLGPSAPTLLAPGNNRKIAARKPIFDWSDSVGAGSYQIWVDNSPADWSSLVINQTVAASTYQPGSNLPYGVYEWAVQPYNGAWGLWSSVYTFSVIPKGPTHLSPANGSSTTARKPLFRWKAQPEVTKYHLQVDNNSDFSSPEVSRQVTTNQYRPTSNLPLGTFYWRLRSYGNGVVWGQWSNAWTVTITGAARDGETFTPDIGPIDADAVPVDANAPAGTMPEGVMPNVAPTDAMPINYAPGDANREPDAPTAVSVARAGASGMLVAPLLLAAVALGMVTLPLLRRRR